MGTAILVLRFNNMTISAVIKQAVLDILMDAESLIDGVKRRDVSKPAMIVPHIGYVTPDNAIIRGRLVTARHDIEKVDPTVWDNIFTMVRLFLTDEISDVEIVSGGVSARTDEEGYFELTLPRPTVSGKHYIDVSVPEFDLLAKLPVIVPAATAKIGVISDIDDTVLLTEAWSLPKNIANTFRGNALNRIVFDDAVRLYQSFAEKEYPVFYVSSSPWNLHGFLMKVFTRTQLPMGPIFLRDFGIGENQLITGTHGDHKVDAIKTILRANHYMKFILIGDTGQHDPQVYATIATEHANRLRRVIFRQAGPIVDKDNEAGIEIIRTQGVPVECVTSYDDLKGI
jgi:phosphatidate phosphatase APP1